MGCDVYLLMGSINRRQYPRFEGKFNVDLLNMGDDPSISSFEPVIPALGLDVSRKGLRLQSRYQVNVGSFLSAIVYYKGQGSVCLCEVVWKREEDGQFLYGLFIKEWSQLEMALDRELKRIETLDVTGQSQISSDQDVMSKTVLV